MVNGIAPRGGLGMRETENKREQPAGHQQQTAAGPADRGQPPHRLSARAGSASDRTGGEDEVDEERPSPRRVRGEDAAKQKSERAACASDGAVDAESLPTLRRISEGGGQEGQD